MKKRFKIFLKAFYISSVILFCLLIGILGISKAYENIRLISFGEYRKAIEISEGNFKFFDYSFATNTDLIP